MDKGKLMTRDDGLSSPRNTLAVLKEQSKVQALTQKATNQAIERLNHMVTRVDPPTKGKQGANLATSNAIQTPSKPTIAPREKQINIRMVGIREGG